MPERHLTIKSPALARVEGEGGLYVKVRRGQVEDLRLEIYEPPRFFEALLKGRHYVEPVDMTARVCGICPVAYQMSAAQALEAACGVTVSDDIRELRRLLYCGEWIQSHALHIYLLHAPDFLGLDSAVEMARRDPALIARGLRLKRAGDAVIETVGGRSVHPVNPCIGGFYKAPTLQEIQALEPILRQALDDADATVCWVSGFSFPEATLSEELVSLRHPSEYPVLGGRVVSSEGLDIAVADFANAFQEAQSPHSTALVSSHSGKKYLCGPLARFNLNQDRLSSTVLDEARTVGAEGECRNPFRSIVVRALEVMESCVQALDIISRYRPPDPSAMPVGPVLGSGHGATEAPRGLLYQRYRLDRDGMVEEAVIVPPTAQNQLTIEADVRRVVESNLDLPDEKLQRLCEQAIRNHDPCISCATHFLRLEVDR